jgi:23S rRNA pseudouridine2457 synthase
VTVIALWNPYGVVSRFGVEPGRTTLRDLVPVRDVYPVGRLDADSEGLLLLSDDGALAHALTDPRHAHPRTYWVQVEREPDAAALAALARGVVVQGRRTRPAHARRLRGEPDLPGRAVPIRTRKAIPTAWIELTLAEGRNRQVRRMTAAVGFPTLRLVRVAIGTLRLLDLGIGPSEWRPLAPQEERSLRAAARPSPSRAAPRAKSSRSGSSDTTR